MSIAAAYDSLESFLIEGGAPGDVGTDTFTVNDEASADWALRVIARHRRALANAEQVAAAEQDRIDIWLADQRHRCAESTAYLLGMLESFHRRTLDENPKAKTIRLPAGNLVARKAPDTVQVDDPPMFVAWAERVRCDLLRTKVEPDKAKIKQLLGHDADDGTVVDPSTGERVPGVSWVQGDVRFSADTEATA